MIKLLADNFTTIVTVCLIASTWLLVIIVQELTRIRKYLALALFTNNGTGSLRRQYRMDEL